jgi:O-antigen/teichoic acid export membrane protein
MRPVGTQPAAGEALDMLDDSVGQRPVPSGARWTSAASIVSLHKVVQIVGSVVTVVLVPRLLGVESYGRFAFVLSLAYLGQILGDFGTLDVFGRFVPGMTRDETRQLYMRTLSFKLVVGPVCGIITAVAGLLLGDWMRLDWAALLGLSVALHIVAWVPFQLSLGLSRVGAWMTEQAWRQWVLLLGLLVLFPWLGFTGVLLALALMEALFFLLGLWYARDYWQRKDLDWDWTFYRPFVRAGAGFFLANMTVVALYRSGPVLVEVLTGQIAQVGYIDLAIGLFLMVYVTVSQFAQSLIPTLGRLLAGGDRAAYRRTLGSFIRIGLLITIVGTAAVWLLAPWAVPVVFGVEFGPAASAMRWISLGMPLAVLAWSGNIVATVSGRGATKFSASLIGLVVFLIASLILVPEYGAAGAALGLSLAVLAHVVMLVVQLGSDFRGVMA